MLGTLLKRLRGQRGPDPSEQETYHGYLITATPERTGDGWRVAGRITRADAPDGPDHRFLRVDSHPDRETIVGMALQKGRLLVDEQGDSLLR